MILAFNSNISQMNTAGVASKKKDKPAANVYVIDVFKPITEDIDGDKNPDISRGAKNSTLVKNNNPNINIKNMDCSDSRDIDYFSINKVKFALKEISTRVENGEKVDAINISINQPMYYKGLSTSLKKLITPENLSENKVIIRDMITQSSLPDKSGKIDQNVNTVKEIIEECEKLVKRGVNIVVPSGSNSLSFNALSLVDGVVAIGGLYKGQEVEQLSNNSLISDWEEISKSSTPVKNTRGDVVGYDISGNGISDFSKYEVTSEGKSPVEKVGFAGISYAAATYLNKTLEAKLSQQGE